MFAYFVVKTPRFPSHFMADIGCIAIENTYKGTKSEENSVPVGQRNV